MDLLLDRPQEFLMQRKEKDVQEVEEADGKYLHH